MGEAIQRQVLPISHQDVDVAATYRIDATRPPASSGDEALDVGADTTTPVSDDDTSRESQFTGHIHRVQIDLGDDA